MFQITAVIGEADSADKAFARILDSVAFDHSGGIAVDEFQFDDGNCKFSVKVEPSTHASKRDELHRRSKA